MSTTQSVFQYGVFKRDSDPYFTQIVAQVSGNADKQWASFFGEPKIITWGLSSRPGDILFIPIVTEDQLHTVTSQFLASISSVPIFLLFVHPSLLHTAAYIQLKQLYTETNPRCMFLGTTMDIPSIRTHLHTLLHRYYTIVKIQSLLPVYKQKWKEMQQSDSHLPLLDFIANQFHISRSSASVSVTLTDQASDSLQGHKIPSEFLALFRSL